MLRRAPVGICAALVGLVVAAAPSPVRAQGGTVVERQATFEVTNTNTSAMPCTSDGRRYQVHGNLVGPPSELARPKAGAVTVYLHGFNVAGWMWHFKAVDGYDYVYEYEYEYEW